MITDIVRRVDATEPDADSSGKLRRTSSLSSGSSLGSGPVADRTRVCEDDDFFEAELVALQELHEQGTANEGGLRDEEIDEQLALMEGHFGMHPHRTLGVALRM